MTLWLKQVAQDTGLAQATVSRILRHCDQCSPATRRRVLEAARHLKYRPNLLSQSLHTGSSRMVGVLLPVADEFFGRIFHGLHEYLVQHDYVPIVLWCYDALAGGEQHVPSELKQIHRLIDRRVDGVILRPVDDAISDEYLREVWDHGVPLIAVDRELEHTHAHFVGVDDLAIGRLAAEHLLSLGHHRLGHVAGPDEVTTANRRRRGFEHTVQRAGLTCRTVVDPSFGIDVQGIQHLLGSPDRPTAVFAANDNVAHSIYRVAAELGLSIPADLSVIGCGNLSCAELMAPALTTFDQQPENIGREAARMLLDGLTGHKSAASKPLRTLLPPHLLQRCSTAPPATKTPPKENQP